MLAALGNSHAETVSANIQSAGSWTDLCKSLRSNFACFDLLDKFFSGVIENVI